MPKQDINIYFRYAAAEEDCCRSLTIDSEYAKAIARRATARTKLKKFQGAIEDYEHLVVLQPNNKQAITELDKLKKVIRILLIRNTRL